MGFYGLAGALFLAAVVGAFSVGYGKGSASRNGEIAEYQAAIEVSQRLAADAERKAAETSAKVVVEYRDRVKVIRESAPPPQIIEVIKHETPAGCVAPGAFRLLHDSAASGSPIPESAAGTDAAPVEIDAIARTVAENYRIANENAARLEALQSLVNSQ